MVRGTRVRDVGVRDAETRGNQVRDAEVPAGPAAEWTGVIVAVAGATGLSLVAIRLGLDRADNSASVISAILALLTVRGPRLVRRGPAGRQAPTIRVLAGAVVVTGALLASIRWLPLSPGWRLAIDLGGTALAVAVTGWLLRTVSVPVVASSEIRDAVAAVHHHDRKVGSAVRVGERLLVTSAEAVDRALDRPRDGAGGAYDTITPPPEDGRVSLRLRLPRDGSQYTARGRVVGWGPALSRLSYHNLAVLRSVEPLPRGVPRLARSGLADSVVVPVVGGPGRQADTGSVRGLVTSVTRRQVLRAGAWGVGAAALGGAAVISGGSGIGGSFFGSGASPGPKGPIRPPLTGAGWREVFDRSEVRELLNQRGFSVGPVDSVSGVQTICTGMNLADRSFVTAPSEVVARKLKDRYQGAGFLGPVLLCDDYLVVLATRYTARQLRDQGLIGTLHPSDPESDRHFPRPSLDLGRYLAAWKASQSGRSGAVAPPRLGYSDPATAGGGLMLVSMIDQLQNADDQALDQLFKSGGLFYANGATHTDDLLRTLLKDGGMVCVYEHLAISFLLGERPGDPPATAGDRKAKYVMLYLYPDIGTRQQLLAKDQALLDLFADDPELRSILAGTLHLRIREQGDHRPIDHLLTGPLADALGDGQPARELAPPTPGAADFKIERQLSIIGRVSSRGTCAGAP